MNSAILQFLTLLVIAVQCVSIAASQSVSRPGFIFLPFEDKSDFEGKWDVGTDVPRFLSAYFKERFRVPSISPVLVKDFMNGRRAAAASLDDVKLWMELFKRFHLRYLIAGTVDQFDVSRFMTGQPLVGGYEAFKGEVRISYVVYDLERTAVSSSPVSVRKGEAAGEFADRSMTLTLFGKPSDRTIEFRDLDKIAFGSEDFNGTVIGQAHFRLAEHVSVDLENALKPLKGSNLSSSDSLLLYGQSLDNISLSLKPVIITGAIVFLEGKSVFINLGSDDGIYVGQHLDVFDEGRESTRKRKGEIEILDVRGPHLSHAQILIGHKELKVKDKVMVTLIKP
ncbi:MAG TPA: hypothetical protein DCP63_05720 [Bacteroidetes bacterium]|nr:hypothetical protein [Bacteroidota bacterium]